MTTFEKFSQPATFAWRPVLALVLSALLSACASQSQDASFANLPRLLGTEWKLVQIQSMNDDVFTPLVTEVYVIEFLPEGRVALHVDCNRGQGSWEQEGLQLIFSEIAVTRAMCRPQSLEYRFLQDLRSVRSFVIEDGHLFLATFADGAILKLEPAPG